jgi:hypothetical protein
MNRSGAARHWFYTHKYIEGILTVIEEVSETDVSFNDGVTDEQLASILPVLSEYPSYDFLYQIIKKINYTTSEMEIVKSKYLLYVLYDYDLADWKLIGEYDADSNIGRQLEKLVDWQ